MSTRGESSHMQAVVVDQHATGENKAVAESPAPLVELILVAIRHWRLLFFLPLSMGLIALAIAFAVKPTFTSTARIIPPSQQAGMAGLISQQLGALAGLAGAAGLKNPADQYVSLAKSRNVTDAIIKKFDLRNRYEKEFIEEVLDELDAQVRITASTRDGMISIEASDHDPKFAAALANEFVDRLRDLSNSIAVAEAAERRTFYEQQLAEVKGKLDDAQAKLQRSGVSESLLKAEPRAAIETIARLRAAVTSSEVRIATMRGIFSDSNPEIQLAKKELAAIQDQLNRAEASSSAPMGKVADNYIELYRNFKYHESLYEILAKQFELSKIDEAKEGAFIQIVDVAVPAEKKSKPKKGVIAVLTTIATFIVTLGFLLSRESFRRLFRDPRNRSHLSNALSVRKSR